ncbi:glucosaminidase domain-containing protein [Marinobacter mobilis]|uniref:Bax protein n=1 Tax=Marinobacter mobilis TaxID=488533 RepID=A0A1H2THB2_9GAMM|nr:glucosaminidase domain-containing protein [Marinobacter mobilis]SDW43353.1 Bax protein [Marinobacter mobilis]
MSAVFRASLLLVPLAMVAVFSVFHGSNLSLDPDGNDDFSLSASGQLPALPAWAKAPLPVFSDYRDTTEKKAAFFSFLYPRIVLANSRLLLARQYLLTLAQKPALSPDELAWLDKLMGRLRVDGEPGSAATLTELTHKLDAIPPSLILAQAANESAWGTSRFARVGNNLFGQWCFTRGCGLVPLNRVDGANHEVASFDSPYDSVTGYILNINRHRSYRELRQLRTQARDNGQFADGALLAQGLSRYSERGQAYVEEIRSMIHHNNLGYFDRQFNALLENRSARTLRLIAASDDEQQISEPLASSRQASDNEG